MFPSVCCAYIWMWNLKKWSFHLPSARGGRLWLQIPNQQKYLMATEHGFRWLILSVMSPGSCSCPSLPHLYPLFVRLVSGGFWPLDASTAVLKHCWPESHSQSPGYVVVLSLGTRILCVWEECLELCWGFSVYWWSVLGHWNSDSAMKLLQDGAHTLVFTFLSIPNGAARNLERGFL